MDITTTLIILNIIATIIAIRVITKLELRLLAIERRNMETEEKIEQLITKTLKTEKHLEKLIYKKN